MPQFGIARERARKASCVSNQRNVETAVAMWTTDNPSAAYVGDLMSASTPSYTQLTGSPTYSLPGAFVEPDAGGVGGTAGEYYYLSQGTATGGTANQAAPSYGHVACAFDGAQDPWVADYDTATGNTSYDHRRGVQASPSRITRCDFGCR